MKWISSKERLPEETGTYAVMDREELCFARITEWGSFYSDGWEDTDFFDFERCDYWMEIRPYKRSGLKKPFLDTTLKNLVPHNPPYNYGDCFRTCLACLIGLEQSKVPHFFEKGKADTQTQNSILAWCESQGYELMEEVREFSPDQFIQDVIDETKGSKVPMLLGGCTEEGINHSVVIYNGETIMNPGSNKITKSIHGKILLIHLTRIEDHWKLI